MYRKIIGKIVMLAFLHLPRCCAATWHSFNSRELNFHAMIPSLEMDKGCRYEAAACEVNRNNRSLPKTF